NFTFTPSDMTIQELWARYYSVIERCNVVIDAATRSNDISLKAQNRAVGEAKFVRAYSYFQLVQFFGDLPLIDKRTITVDYSVSRSPIKEIYKFIVEDLTFAASDNILPIEIVDGSATHWAAKSLLAKVYLTMASCKETARIDGYSKIENSSEQLYQQANIILKDIINNSGRELLPRYEDVFKIENKNKNKESIWEVQYSSIEPYGNQWTKEMGANASGGYSGANGGWRTNTLAGNCALRPLPSLRGYYKERDNSLKYDKRRVWNLIDSTVVFDKTTGVPLRLDFIANLSSANAIDNSNQTVISQGAASKYRWGNDWRESTPFLYSNCPNNVIILRYADILLMFAETEIKLNGNRPTQLAVESINRL
ncbi:MAG: RagB/SusD family nutrient uptake outer membrane protein, partial [Brevinema sp.]